MKRYTIEDIEQVIASADETPRQEVEDSDGTVSGTVKRGARTHTIVSLTGTMLRRGLGPDEILPMAMAVSENRFNPPLPQKKIVETVKDVCERYRNQTGRLGTAQHGVPSRDARTVRVGVQEFAVDDKGIWLVGSSEGSGDE